MKIKKVFFAAIAAAVGISILFAGCKNSRSEAETTVISPAKVVSAIKSNKDKPVCWFNRQPSNSSTGALDLKALNFNKDTYYVGFDAVQGGVLQGQMISDYIKSHALEIDRNGDGIIGYIIAIGDIGHNDSIARTQGVREYLGTGISKNGTIDSAAVGINVNGDSDVVQDSEIEAGGKTYKVRELASQEMKNSAGATWDAATAANTLGIWAACFGDQIDIIVSNNDGMGMAMFSFWAKKNHVPTFGYDADSDAVAAIEDGYAGTISQRADVQAYMTLRVVRNALDGVDVNTGIGIADSAGNCLTEGVDYRYAPKERSYYALNAIVNADNYRDFTDSTKICSKVSHQLDISTSPKKRVWLNVYDAANSFLGSTYLPLLQQYDKLLNLETDYIGGDGQTESNITNRLANASEYDAFCINMVKTDNAGSYMSLLRQTTEMN